MSRKLILGSVSRKRLLGLTPIGVVHGREVYPLQGAEDDNPSDNDGDKDGEGDNEGDDNPDDDGDGDEDDAKGQKTSRRNRSRGTQNNVNAELRTLRKFKRDVEEANRAQELKDKPEIERLTAERDHAAKQRDDLLGRYTEAATELAIIQASQKSKFAWADYEDVLSDRTLRKAIDIDEDGNISGVEDALKDLAKRKPHFLRKSEEDNSKDKGGAGKNGSGAANGKSGGNPSGSNGTGDRAADRELLRKKYPILGSVPME